MRGDAYRSVSNIEYLKTILQTRRGLNVDENEVAKFVTKNIPPIIDRVDLSTFIGIDSELVNDVCEDQYKIDIHYRKFKIKKRNGSARMIYAPRTYLKVVQWWILDNILNCVKFDKNIFGFVPGRNIVQNAEFHFGAKHILNVDIKDFFPSITIDQVKKIFLEFGYSEDVSNMLSQICCLKNRVPQGAPTSPALGNLVFKDLDHKLTFLSDSRGLKYSRYADDLTFSSTEWIDDSFLYEVTNIINIAGFQVNRKKTRFAGPQDRLEVTGVVINNKIQPSRKWRKRVRAILNRYRKQGRITQYNLSYLYGIIGVSGQYKDSHQMKKLSNEAKNIIIEKRHTVIGYEGNMMLLNGLTELQTKALSSLSLGMTNTEIAEKLEISKSSLGRILQSSYVKISVYDREGAQIWARENL